MRAAPPVLLFDLDGTLVDTARTTAHAFSLMRQERGYTPIDAEPIKPYISLGGQELTRFAMGEALVDVEIDLGLFRSLLAQLPADPDEIYPGVEAALGALASRGFAMAIVTNKPQAIADRLLRALGLTRFFDVVVGGDSVPYKKPHPAHIAAVLAAVNAQAHEAVLIGDSEVDASAAEASGIRFVHFTGGYCGPQLLEAVSYPRFSHFNDLIILLDGMTPTSHDVARPKSE